MSLKSINILTSYDELNIDLEKNNTFIIFDEGFNKEKFPDLFQNEYRNKIFLINQYSIKKHISSIKINNDENLIILIKLSNDYKICKKIIKYLMNTFKEKNSCNVIYYIIENDSKYREDFINSIKAIHITDKEEKYAFIYDTTCEFLDKQFDKCNFCDFKNDKCIANRNNGIHFKEMGCCYSFEYANIFDSELVKNIKLCDNLKDKKCITKNISCKLFTCGYLKKKKIRFDTHKILLLDCFFNQKQHDIINLNFFKSRESILEKLLEKNHDVYIWYLFKRKYMVK